MTPIPGLGTSPTFPSRALWCGISKQDPTIRQKWHLPILDCIETGVGAGSHCMKSSIVKYEFGAQAALSHIYPTQSTNHERTQRQIARDMPNLSLSTQTFPQHKPPRTPKPGQPGINFSTIPTQATGTLTKSHLPAQRAQVPLAPTTMTLWTSSPDQTWGQI